MIQNFELDFNFHDSLEDILSDFEFVQKGKNLMYLNVASSFDIEASSFYEGTEKRCCMYAWVFGINGRCFRGRTWDEFIDLTDKLIKRYNISQNKRIIIYIHNLAYEFQWIKHRFKWKKVFSLEQRKPIYALTEDGIEFRCSYILTNLKLETVGENLLKYKVKKLVGSLDYDLIRHSETVLSDEEWSYIIHDGLVVMAHIQEEIERLGDITKIPLTNTGYVRNLCRENCLKGEEKFKYNKLMRYLQMTPEDYLQAKDTFIGGFTHANHNHVNKLCKNVVSYDFTSSYIAVMLSEKFPMSPAKSIKISSEDEFYKYLNSYCCMFTITFKNITSKLDFEHYISKSKCFFISDYILDNGRVVSAKELQISITEQDYFIINEMYDWDEMIIGNFKVFYKDYLPKPFIETILTLYENKTKLKNIEGKEQEYMQSKGMANACYGMAVTDPCKDETNYTNDEGWITEDSEIDRLLFRYNYSSSRFLFYFWGIWITAYARYNLFTGILECKDDYIYSDTDSLKLFNHAKHKQYFENYNNTIKYKIKKCLNHHHINYKRAEPETNEGVKKPLGVWDFEGDYPRFKTLGAKRYIYEDSKNNLHITISGVAKKNGIEYLYFKYKNLDKIFSAFQDNLEFPAYYFKNNERKLGCGKLLHTYIDIYHSGYITDYLGKTSTYSEFSGEHLEPTGYNLGLSADFKNYLLGIKGDYICQKSNTIR